MILSDGTPQFEQLYSILSPGWKFRTSAAEFAEMFSNRLRLATPTIDADFLRLIAFLLPLTTTSSTSIILCSLSSGVSVFFGALSCDSALTFSIDIEATHSSAAMVFLFIIVFVLLNFMGFGW